MNVSVLLPAPTQREAFRRSRERFIPDRPGCYALTTFPGWVMYVGLAKDLRRRFGEHLDSPEKTAITEVGKAIVFWWYETEDTNRVERTWMNTHIQHEGKLPLLNSIYSPTAV